MEPAVGLLYVEFVAQDWFIWVEETNEEDEVNESEDGVAEDDLWALAVPNSLVDRVSTVSIV